jgi:2-octaprenyl-6-methoxyphenol hydroxylase
MKPGRHDVLIVGGGLAGLSLMLALKGAGLRVVLIEATAGNAIPPSFDDRHLALSLASVEGLRGLGIGPALEQGTQPIQELQVSSEGEFGSVQVKASDYGLPYLGLVCPAHRLGQSLHEAAAALADFALLRQTELLSLERMDDHWQARLSTPEGERVIAARLVVGSDGTGSRVRSLCDIASNTTEYQQRAIVTNIEVKHARPGVAYERFTRTGPLALLPLPSQRLGVIWTKPSEQASALMAGSDEDFRHALNAALPSRFGRLQSLGKRQSYPLALTIGEQSIAWRAALIGNAAQTIHPIGAQGFNLGLRDALGLARVLGKACDDPGDAQLLERFAQERAADRERTIRFSDGLVALTSSRLPFASILRSAGLLALDRVAPLKKLLLEFGVGFGR